MRNYSILDDMVHYKSIFEIWWNDLISQTSSSYQLVRKQANDNVDQLIPFCKSNKVRSEKMIGSFILQTKQPINMFPYS